MGPGAKGGMLTVQDLHKCKHAGDCERFCWSKPEGHAWLLRVLCEVPKILSKLALHRTV